MVLASRGYRPRRPRPDVLIRQVGASTTRWFGTPHSFDHRRGLSVPPPLASWRQSSFPLASPFGAGEPRTTHTVRATAIPQPLSPSRCRGSGLAALEATLTSRTTTRAPDSVPVGESRRTTADLRWLCTAGVRHTRHRTEVRERGLNAPPEASARNDRRERTSPLQSKTTRRAPLKIGEPPLPEGRPNSTW